MSSLFQPHLRGCAAEPELLPAGTFPPKWMNPRVGRPYDPRDTSGTSNHHISSDNCPPLGIFTSKTLCTTAETGSPRNPTIDEQSSKIGRVARPFDHSDAPNKVGAPLFAFFAKGGRDAACSADFDIAQIQYFKQHHTRPCQQRNDGAPTLIDRVGSSKPGPPAPFCNSIQRHRTVSPLAALCICPLA